MDTANAPFLLSVIVAMLLFARFFMQMVLDRLNQRSVLAAADQVPAAFAKMIDEETYAKSVAYTLAKSRFSMVSTMYDTAILALVLFSGVLPLLWASLSDLLGSGLWSQAGVLFLILFLLGLPSLPFDWYSQFRLEERFGFNKSTLSLWISDKFKGLLIGFALGFPLLYFLLWIVQTSALWWLYAAVVIFVIQLVLMVLYPMFILPLFNKFEPLPEGDLKNRLFSLGDRTGFKAKTILVMDGSRRSGHSNAYFTGWGRFRRIVLYDTLIEQLSPTELEAVLAHEIGHYKLGHIPKMLVVGAVFLFLSFAILGYLATLPLFVEAFGFTWEAGQLGPVFLLFSMLSGIFTFWLSPATNQFSRKHEYEADAFAKDAMAGKSEPIIGALRALNTKNLSNLTPHPLYSAFYYSHPTLVEREASVRGEGG